MSVRKNQKRNKKRKRHTDIPIEVLLEEYSKVSEDDLRLAEQLRNNAEFREAMGKIVERLEAGKKV